MQLLTLSALALIGVALLWRRWRALPRWQRRRPAQIVINCFSLSLVMLAALLIAGAFQLPGFEIIRLATFARPGWRHWFSCRTTRRSPRQGGC